MTKPQTITAARNRARCRKCQDIVESKHRHDFVQCKCGAIAVDGGTDYWRGVGDLADFERLGDQGDDS